MSRAVLSLGSNLGDRLAHLRGAVDGLRDVLVATSAVYETAPWGVLDQPDFLNAVVVVDAAGNGPYGWLERARDLESAAGRQRGQRWGPRTLDVDVVTVDEVRCADPDLTLPHPGAHERATVLVPWLDVEPHAELLGHGPVRDLLVGLDTSGVHRLDGIDLGEA